MLFNSYNFLFIYLPLVLAGFFALRRQNLRVAFVVVATHLFYAFEAWWFPALMLTFTAISFTAAHGVAASAGRRRKLVLAGGSPECSRSSASSSTPQWTSTKYEIASKV
jgi:alginate O-acetyltransferase complex protein AlgI